MARPLLNPVWTYRALFVAIAIGVTLFRMLPLSTAPARLPGPEVLTCLACAWVLRRPDYVPAFLIALVFLFEDFVLMRPPGLWALIILMGTEFLRGRVVFMRELGLALEWAMVSVVMVAMVLLYRLAYAVAFIDNPPLSLVALQMLGTILSYPLVVGVSRYGLGLRKAAAGEVDRFGRRV